MRDFRNNILVNARSNNGATGKHYAAYFNYATSTNLTLDYNLYYAPGTGGVLGYINTLDNNSLPLVIGNDTHSSTANPSFYNPGGINATDYVIANTSPLFEGAAIAGVVTDYLGINRVSNTMGAFEFVNTYGDNINTYIGPNNGLWSTTSNWSLNHIPTIEEHVSIPTHSVVLDVDFEQYSYLFFAVSNTGGINVNPNKTLTINGTASFGNCPILFKSDATGYGQLGKVSGTITGATNVQSENYVAALRAYRLLTSPVTTTTSIHDNWQEGSNNTSLDYANNQNPTTGFGTHITGSATGTNGFDATATGNPSLYTFDNATQAWSAIANTNNTALTVGQPYRLMVRGDRSIDLSTNTPNATNTVLRATGALQVGNLSTTLSATANHYNLVANPYQAPINAYTMFAAGNGTFQNINNQFFYVWDVNLGSRGAYSAVSINTSNINNPTYSATGGSTHTQMIAPWEAFFIKTLNDGPASITFKESYKNNPLVPMGRTNNNLESSSLILNLKGLQTNGSYNYVDGIRMDFGADYSLAIDQFDAEKFINLDEDVAIQKADQSLLTIERRTLPDTSETVPLYITKYRSASYVFENQVVGLEGLQAYLKDNYTNTLHELEGTPYTFTVNTAIPATFEINRFELVFQPTALAVHEVTNNIIVYPNPSKSGKGITIEGIEDNTSIQVYTMLGQHIPVTTSSTATTFSVQPITELSKGIYIITISNEGKTTQVKWIVE